MALNDTAKNLMLDAFATAADYVSLHTDVVGSGSGGEVTGGSPAYARKSHTWNAASTGALDNSNQPVFDVPGSTTVRRIGFWDSLTTGTFYGDADITDETFGGQGTYTLTDCDVSIT